MPVRAMTDMVRQLRQQRVAGSTGGGAGRGATADSEEAGAAPPSPTSRAISAASSWKSRNSRQVRWGWRAPLRGGRRLPHEWGVCAGAAWAAPLHAGSGGARGSAAHCTPRLRPRAQSERPSTASKASATSLRARMLHHSSVGDSSISEHASRVSRGQHSRTSSRKLGAWQRWYW